VMSLPGWTLPVATAVIFGLIFFGVFTSIHPIAGFNTKGTAERFIPILEPGDEEPPANRAKDDTPTPVLLPASTETLPAESIDMATDPQASEAVEFILQKPLAEAGSVPVDPVLPAADPPSLESPSSKNTPALSQDPAQLSADPHADEMPLPVPSPTAPSDMLMGAEETSPQYPQPPPEPVTDMGTSLQPPSSDLPADPGTTSQPLMSPDETTSETTSSSDLPADSSQFTEDTAYLE
jgi:hypothetical protein